MTEHVLADHRPATALILVDLQEDYLGPGLEPERAELVPRVAALLAGARRAGATIVHVRTIVRADGSDAMPHRRDHPRCVVGTPGAQPPRELKEDTGEVVVEKQHFRSFSNPLLHQQLSAAGVTHVIVAGVHTHACVRETVLEAYELGYTVTIAEDAVASDSPDHAAHTLRWLENRAATLSTVEALLRERWVSTPSATTDLRAHDAITAVVDAARDAHDQWRGVSLRSRRELLTAWAAELRADREAAIATIVAEVRKPVVLARDEVDRALAHIDTACALKDADIEGDIVLDDRVSARQVPVGVIAAIMPWNNPIALATGKIAPALMTGNAVILKPAPEAERSAALLVDGLRRAGAPEGLVSIITGDASVGARLVEATGVDGVCVTGSISTGRAVAAVCRQRGIPIQAELGGNNAAIVLADADLDDVVSALLGAAFAFAGQRCTAVRRFVVDERILESFIERALSLLATFDPREPERGTGIVGPMVSPQAAARVERVIELARLQDVTVLAGGDRRRVGNDVAIAPALLLARDPSVSVVQDETFGPVAVIQPVATVAEAIEVANGVEHGLILSVCTDDADALREIARTARVGILHRGAGSVPVHPRAPFGGWKGSGIGPPEHGDWDIQFFTRPQALYGEWPEADS